MRSRSWNPLSHVLSVRTWGCMMGVSVRKMQRPVEIGVWWGPSPMRAINLKSLVATSQPVAHGRYFILPHRTLLCDPQATSLMLRSSSPSSEGGKDSNMVDELTIHDCDQVSFTIVWCPLWIQFRVYCNVPFLFDCPFCLYLSRLHCLKMLVV